STAVGGLLPSGPVRELVAGAMQGLKELAVGVGAPSTLGKKALDLLPGLTRGVAGFVRSVLRDAIPDRSIASLVGGLVQEVLELFGKPKRWKNLIDQGAGYVFGRVLPVVRDFLLGM